MKTKFLLMSSLILLDIMILMFSCEPDSSTPSNAQIPNGGFENWTNNGGHEYPTGWASCNLGGGPDYPVSKSTDHYPINIGNYSVSMVNNATRYQQGYCAAGFVNTALYLGYWGPTFPIIGHPNSFCGYYKFLPQNNDTMLISLYLYKNKAIVASAVLSSTSTVSNWTPFTIPISTYTTVDSAAIGFSAFYCKYGQSPYGPWGNSVLYVDNISFDNLIH